MAELLSGVNLFIVSVLGVTLYIGADSGARMIARERILGGGQRKVLATVRGDLKNDGGEIFVAKVLEADSLFIEIHEMRNNQMQFVAKEVLPDKSDAYFVFMGEATNLALANLDSDNYLEILAPSFDREMNARLNVIKFDKGSQEFGMVLKESDFLSKPEAGK